MTPQNYRKITASDIGFAADQKILNLPNSGSACLIRDYRKIRPCEISSIMAMYAELFARAKNLETGHQNLLSLLRGMVALPRRILLALLKYGMSAKRSHSRSLVAQAVDMCKVWWETSMLPNDYYDGQLAKHSGTDAVMGYLPWALIANVIVELQFNLFGPLTFALNDKAAVAQWCRENGVQCAGGMALDGDSSPPDIEAITSIGDSLFVKARSEMAGLKAEVWRQEPDSSWSGQDRNLSSQELTNWFVERAARDTNGIVIQELLKNHPDLEEVCGSVLSTCRVVTILNERDEPEIVESHWRMATDRDAIVDNFHSGGIAWDIHNFQTGEIIFALRKDSSNQQEITLLHPVTGRRLAGTCHPFWSQMRDLALNAHRAMNGVLFVGWDIAVTPQGATVVEMNLPADLSPNTQLKWEGIKNSRLAEILAWRAQIWLRQNVEPASRRQIGLHCQAGTNPVHL